MDGASAYRRFACAVQTAGWLVAGLLAMATSACVRPVAAPPVTPQVEQGRGAGEAASQGAAGKIDMQLIAAAEAGDVELVIQLLTQGAHRYRVKTTAAGWR